MQWKLSKDTESIIVIPQLLDEEFKKNIQILFNKVTFVLADHNYLC
jgi:hypothetical protein